MLRVEGLNHYYGGSHTLEDITFEVAAGTCTAVLGRNGVGKSTLLKSLMGVERVRSGTITFDDQEYHARRAAHPRAPRHGLRAAGTRNFFPAHRGREFADRIGWAENPGNRSGDL